MYQANKAHQGPHLCRDAPAGKFSLQLWRQHVLANLPMYSMLLPLYLDLACSRVSNRCEETLVDLKRVNLQPLASLSHSQ